jgi:hypothetical protein
VRRGNAPARQGRSDAPALQTKRNSQLPTLKDLAAVTSRLDELTTELHSELTAGAIDFDKMVELADDIGRHSDRLASAFTTMGGALKESLDGPDAEGSEGEGGGDGGGPSG